MYYNSSWEILAFLLQCNFQKCDFYLSILRFKLIEKLINEDMNC